MAFNLNESARRLARLLGLALLSVGTQAASAVTPMVAAGGYHSVALKQDGTVWAWGDNSRGQLGDGTVLARNRPVAVRQLDGISAIAAGEAHTLALGSDGTVWAWGANDNGQLGDGSAVDRGIAAPVSRLGGVVAIAAGGGSSLALMQDGTVMSWGNNRSGQLGAGAPTPAYQGPPQVAPASRSVPGPIPGLDSVVAIAIGDNHALALKSDGSVWAWGSNYSAQRGDLDPATLRSTPMRVGSLPPVTAIAAGNFHSLALGQDGGVWEWGASNYHQQDANNPSLPPAFSCTGFHGYSLPCAAGPRQAATLSGVVAIAAGFDFSIALRTDGNLWTWSRPVPYPSFPGQSAAPAPGLSGVVACAAGNAHILAVRADGGVAGWGDNHHGQIGDGSTTRPAAPVSVADAAGYGPFNLNTAGSRAACAEIAVHRYRNTQIPGDFYTTDASEGNAQIAAGAPLRYEGVAFSACAGGSSANDIYPVYRFRHQAQPGVYLYSMLPPEIDSIRANLGGLLQDEGVAYHAFNAPAAGRAPVYRFRNTGILGAHFFTIAESEKASVIATVPGYAYEGISFFAMPPR